MNVKKGDLLWLIINKGFVLLSKIFEINSFEWCD